MSAVQASGSAAGRFWEALETFGASVALDCGDGSITYAGLAARADAFVAAMSERLPEGVTRPLVLLEAGNHPDPIAAYLGALRAGWPVILAEPGMAAKTGRLASLYRPNIVLALRSGAWIAEVPENDQPGLAPELAVMLSTSGTTGSAKLVRLSASNIAANARSIVEYLGLSAADCAITALPWHYSYGMSVLHTLLLVGGRIALCDHSLVDPQFWDRARQDAVTILPLVPMQFDILESRGFDRSHLPSLRLMTQAGGRLDPALAAGYARMAAREGFSFFVMYGQTEASPRIAYVPPSASPEAYATVGRAIPGGTLRIIGEDGSEIAGAGRAGELVYTGPNVMMGYAESREDLSLSGHLPELHTGDIAERTAEGYFRIIGRTKRFIKLNGLRISLDEIESALRAEGVAAWCTGSDETLAVFVSDRRHLDGLADRLRRDLKLGSRQVSAFCLAEIPALASGKVDYGRLKEIAAKNAGSDETLAGDDLLSVLRRALRTAEIDPDRSFRDYGGDSLSYLEVELALNGSGVSAPEDWDGLPLRDLLALKPSGREGVPIQPVPLDIVWRLAAICAIVANHATTWPVGGGAYFLLVLSGYSLARFQGATLFAGNVPRAMLVTLMKVLAWYYLVLAVVELAGTRVAWPWWALLGNLDQSGTYTKIFFYWYVSALAQVVAMMCLPFAIPPIRRWVALRPFAAGCVALALVALAFERLEVHAVDAEGRLRHTIGALELSILGWCIFFARSPLQKALASVALLGILLFHWDDAAPSVLAFIALGSISLIYSFRLHLPAPAARAVAYGGGLTLAIYMLHPFVLALVQRAGIAHSDPNWPNSWLFAATLAGSLVVAAVAVRLERPVWARVAATMARRLPTRFGTARRRGL